MILEKIYIEKFRAFNNIEIPLGQKLTAIAGRNGTQKTTLLGIIGQPFSLSNKTTPLYGARTIDGYNFRSQFKEKFKLSEEKDLAGMHKWKLYFTNKDIYNDDGGIFGVESIWRNDGERRELRFWSDKGRKKGDGYVRCPVVYLSLKRVSPIGEDKSLISETSALTDIEKQLLKLWYTEIFTIVDDIATENIKDIKSNEKYSIAVESDRYDPFTISAGQDNIGKIFLTILSFKRLHDTYGENYKGGLLLIDEIESTIHPIALEKLLKKLQEFAGDYKIQIIFTTHSADVVIKTLYSAQYITNSKVIYLKKVGDNVNAKINPSLEDIKCDLELIPKKKKKKDLIRVYTEDEVGANFAKRLLNKDISSKVEFVTLKLCHGNYKNLLEKKCKEFLENIIMLDGDQWENPLVPKYKNVLCIPGKVFPEKVLYSYLKSLNELDEFWNNELGGYSKETCFRNHVNATSKEQIKNWFFEQKENFGRGYSKLINRWKKGNNQEYNKFIENFEKALSHCEKNIQKNRQN